MYIFQYILLPQDMAEKAVPGARVRVPFGHRLLDGFVWQRGHSSDVDPGALKYIKTVQTHGALLDAAMRRDIELIAEHFARGGAAARRFRRQPSGENPPPCAMGRWADEDGCRTNRQDSSSIHRCR